MTAFHEDTPDYAAQTRLDGRHIVVLGAGQGIGRQSAIAMSVLGAQVTCVDLELDRAQAVAVQANGRAVQADVTDRRSMVRVFASAVRESGPVHGLVDVVGASIGGALLMLDDDGLSRAFDINLRHVFLAMQIGSKAMTQGGAMVFVSSIAGLRSSPSHAAYGAAKAGLMNLVGTAALDLGPDIRVNAVAPGLTLTRRMYERHFSKPDYEQHAVRQVPLGRIGQPSDIASALAFFISDQSSWVTGQTLVVDGGAGRRFQYEAP